MKAKTIALATLVEDFDLYPRHRVEDTHVSDLMRAIQAGESLPPIIADGKSLRIADGFHRRRAYLRAWGPDAKAPVELHAYASEAELFMDAVSRNSSHGRKLDRHDQTRIVLKMRELNVPDQQIAIRLHVPEPTVQLLSLRIVQAPSGPMPSKRGLEHLRGQSVTNEQAAAIESVRSAEAGRLCLELMRLIENDLVDMSDDRIVGRLKALHSALDLALAGVAA